MARCRVLFCPIHVACRKNALKDPDHNLLVELRALRQMRCMPKIFKVERVCPAFCIIADNFWRLDFNKTFIDKKVPKGLDEHCLDAENSLPLWCAQSERQVVKNSVNVEFALFFKWELFGRAEYRKFFNFHFYVSIQTLLHHLFRPLVDSAGDGNNPLWPECLCRLMHLCVIRQCHHLYHPCCIAQVNKDELAVIATHINPAGDGHRRANMVLQVLYVNHLMHASMRLPLVRGRASSSPPQSLAPARRPR